MPFLDPGASSANGNPPRSPTRSVTDDLDYQLNNMSLLKAQLKVNNLILSVQVWTCSDLFKHVFFQLVSHERDMLKKDVKKITMERDGAYKHLSLTNAGMDFPGHHHHRTASDTASATSTTGKSGKNKMNGFWKRHEFPLRAETYGKNCLYRILSTASAPSWPEALRQASLFRWQEQV